MRLQPRQVHKLVPCYPPGSTSPTHLSFANFRCRPPAPLPEAKSERFDPIPFRIRQRGTIPSNICPQNRDQRAPQPLYTTPTLDKAPQNTQKKPTKALFIASKNALKCFKKLKIIKCLKFGPMAINFFEEQCSI